MKTRPTLVTLAATAWLAASAHAIPLDDFSGYQPGENFTTGRTLGAAEGGWNGGWRTSSSHVQTTGSVETAKPLDAGPYLDVTVFAAAGQPNRSSGAISRPFLLPSKPFKLSFRFRPGVADKDLRYFIFDNDVRAAAPGRSATWQIESRAGHWWLIDGEGNGAPEASVDTELPVVAGTAYAFSLEIDPVRRVWSVTISDGTRTVTRQDLAFRTATPPPERWIHFGANELSNPAVGITVIYSIDSISFQP